MLDKSKTDQQLGLEVHEHLTKIGIETPMMLNTRYESTVDTIEKSTREFLTALGLDLMDDSMSETPIRTAKMYYNELTWGMDPHNFPKCTAVSNKMQYDEMVCERGVIIKSLCEHHLQPIIGTAKIAYMPNKKVLGLSKLNRVAEYFSRRPQVQERLTKQIAGALQYILDTDDVAVIITAEHFCVKMRGMEHDGCSTVTSSLGGMFVENPSTKQEFLLL